MPSWSVWLQICGSNLIRTFVKWHQLTFSWDAAHVGIFKCTSSWEQAPTWWFANVIDCHAYWVDVWCRRYPGLLLASYMSTCFLRVFHLVESLLALSMWAMFVWVRLCLGIICLFCLVLPVGHVALNKSIAASLHSYHCGYDMLEARVKDSCWIKLIAVRMHKVSFTMGYRRDNCSNPCKWKFYLFYTSIPTGAALLQRKGQSAVLQNGSFCSSNDIFFFVFHSSFLCTSSLLYRLSQLTLAKLL